MARLHTVLVLLTLAPLLTACPSYPPEELDFSSDPRILRGSYRASLDSRTAVSGLALSDDETRLLSWGHNAFRLWDGQSGTLLQETWAEPSDRTAAALVGGEAYLAWEYAGDVTVSKLGEAAPLLQLDRRAHARRQELYLNDFALSPDGQFLALSSSRRGPGTSLLVYAVATGALLGTWQEASAYALTSLTFAADGDTLAAFNHSAGELLLWRLGAGERARVKADSAVNALALSPDARFVAVGGEGEVRLLEPSSGRTLHALELEGWVSALAFSADGTRLAGVSWGSEVAVWEVATGQLLYSLRDDEGLGALALGGARLATGSQRGELTLLTLPALSVQQRMSHGALVEATLELTPSYLSRSRYEVAGSATVAGRALALRGVVEGHETQAYERGLAPQARPPVPATFTAQLLDGEAPRWQLEAFAFPWSEGATSWQGGARPSDTPGAFFALVLERD